jgi:hypothetical protein
MTTAATTSENRAGGAGIIARLWRTPLRDLLRGRLSGRLDVRGRIACAALPPPVGDLVLAVVKRTRLWRLEKAEVCEELIAHFADGLDADASAEQLIESFGDARAAARLIRRAKKRQRPLTWQAARYAVRSLAVVIVLYLGYGAYFWMGRPSPTTDYLAQLNAASMSVAEEDRAWPLYRAALLELDELPKFKAYSRTPRPGEMGWAEAQAYLAGQQGALALARRGAERPGLGYIVDHGVAPEDRELWPYEQSPPATDDLAAKSLLTIRLPYLGSLRRLAKVLELDIQRAAAEGDGETVVDNARAMLAMARHAKETPFVINDLVAMSIVSMAVRSLNGVLAESPGALSDDQLRDLAHLLAASDDALAVRLDGERLGMYDLVQRMYTDDGEGGGRITLDGMRMLQAVAGGEGAVAHLPGGDHAVAEVVASPAVGLLMASRRELLHEYDRMMDSLHAAGSRPLWERQRPVVEQRIDDWKRSRVQSIRYLPLNVLMPALGKTQITSEKAIMQRDALLAAIALEIHHRRHGQWPRSLEELVPDLLPAVPPDRFDGQPLRYRLIEGAPVLYSVGTDRDDDGGRPALWKQAGRPDYDAAAQWISAAELEEEKKDQGSGPHRVAVPDADWILWPVPIEPISRYEP